MVLVLHAPTIPISLNVFVIDCVLVWDTEGNPEVNLCCAVQTPLQKCS